MLLLTDEDLAAMRDRAQRHLDGMTVNRDVMANDVLKLVGVLRSERVRRRLDSDESLNFGQGRGGSTRHFRGATFDEALDKAFEAMDRASNG